jgi:hypothetical protein
MSAGADQPDVDRLAHDLPPDPATVPPPDGPAEPPPQPVTPDGDPIEPIGDPDSPASPEPVREPPIVRPPISV